MPKVIETTVYLFNELPDEKAKQKAIEWGYGLVIDYGWWGNVYEDAERVGAKIGGFNIDRGRSIDFELTDSALDVTKKILDEHGETCDTYKLAKDFIQEYQNLDNESDEFDEQIAYLESNFERNLGDLYLEMLEADYAFLSSDEYIQDFLEANEYTFTSNGERFG